MHVRRGPALPAASSISTTASASSASSAASRTRKASAAQGAHRSLSAPRFPSRLLHSSSGGAGVLSGIRARTRKPPVRRSITSSAPPSRTTRSRIAPRPRPPSRAGAAASAPSSSTCTTRWRNPYTSVTATGVAAPECCRAYGQRLLHDPADGVPDGPGGTGRSTAEHPQRDRLPRGAGRCDERAEVGECNGRACGEIVEDTQGSPDLVQDSAAGVPDRDEARPRCVPGRGRAPRVPRRPGGGSATGGGRAGHAAPPPPSRGPQTVPGLDRQ